MLVNMLCFTPVLMAGMEGPRPPPRPTSRYFTFPIWPRPTGKARNSPDSLKKKLYFKWYSFWFGSATLYRYSYNTLLQNEIFNFQTKTQKQFTLPQDHAPLFFRT